jgi:hypothetical protein
MPGLGRHPADKIKAARLTIDRNTPMKLLSYAYRFLSNFVFLALVYYSLNFLEKYQQRAIVAILVLVYAAMRAQTTLRSFYFFHRIERLEVEARRLSGLTGEGPAALASRKHIVTDVGMLRRAGEVNAYIDLLFLAMIVLLCISKIVTN